MRLFRIIPMKILLVTFLVAGLWFAKAHIAEAQVDLGINFAEQIGLADQDPRITAAKIIRIGLGFLGIIAICLLLYAGFMWMTSGGNEEKIATAKKLLINATIGLAIILAAFGIASFIISRLISATGGGGGGGGVCSPSCSAGEVCCSGVCIFGSSCSTLGNTAFTVRNTIPVNAMTNLPRNTVITYKFSEPIRAASVDDRSFVVEDASNNPISGTRTVTGRNIEFVPDAFCPPPHDTLHCLPSTADVFVKAINGSIVSNSGKNLECTGAPCAISFTTGNYVDTENPRINIISQQVCVAPNNTLSGSAIDDFGLRLMDFFVEGSAVGSELNIPPPLTPFNASVVWNGSAFTVGQNIELKATVFDFASNQATAQKRVRISAGHCCNGIQDGDGTEEGQETGVDCGGSNCLACSGQACAMDRNDPDGLCSDELCSSNSCSATGSTPLSCERAGFDTGTLSCCLCQTKPIINSVTPLGGFCSNDTNKSCTIETAVADCGSGNSCDASTPNGNTGNFITITGRDFGTTRGKVFFTGAGGTEIEATLADDPDVGNTDCRANVWTDRQIIAIVPQRAVDGRVVVESSSQTRDTTDDGTGPLINNFKKNTIDRPGLCTINPDSGIKDVVIQYSGVKLNASEAYFGSLLGSVRANSSTFTQPKTGTAQVPESLQTGLTTTYLLQSGIYSNFLEFTKKADPFVGPEIGSIDPPRGPIGQYVTIRGSGFGSSKGNSKIRFGDATGPEADYDFPQVCAQSVWTDRQIIVKVPNRIAVGDYTITLEKDGSAPVNSGIQTFEVITGSPDPGVCRIDPSLGQRNSTVTFWGEYFKTKDANSAVRFYNNQVQSGLGLTFWEIDRSASGAIKPWKVVTTVPTNADSGPVRVEVGSPVQVSNSLNYAVGLCTRDEDCGGTATCCAAGLPEAGRCKADAAQCFGTVATSVYEWQFSTGYQTLSCGADQQQCGTVCCAGGCDISEPNKCAKCRIAGQHRCGDGKCCDNPCVPDNEGRTVCVASCSGYTYNQCIEGYFCPNSPGQCSPTGGTGLPIETGDLCGDDVCDSLTPDCDGNSCEYNQTLNRCVKTAASTNSCEAKDLVNYPRPPALPQIIRINNNPDGDPVKGYCALDGSELRWHIKDWAISCPDGWDRTTTEGVCVDRREDNNGPCSVCADSQSCKMDGNRGVCTVGGSVCPAGSTCDSDDKCKKIDTGDCECCCRIDNAQEDCCAGLSCDGSCGAGPRLGYCSGCVVNGDPVDAMCNCPNSNGKICDASVDPRGRCVDCSAITDPAECSKHDACCVDGRTSANKCTGLETSQPIVEEIIGGETINFCGFYKCTGVYPNSCDGSPYKIGSFVTQDDCDLACVDEPIPCSNGGTCNNSSPACPENFVCSVDEGCTCVPEGSPPGQTCVDPDNSPACLLVGGCKTGYSCLDDAPEDPICRCCCKPPIGGTPDTCKDIDASLNCLADQGNCTGGQRGQCCGCTKDSICGDLATTGCGTTGARCCSARPTVENHLPAIDATNVCRNAAIEVIFDQRMDIASFGEDKNVLLIGDYKQQPCPSGSWGQYDLIALNQPSGRFASLLQPIKRVLIKIAPFLLSRSAFADMSNYCIVSGSAIGSDVSTTKTKLSFRLTRPLESDTQFFVVLKGDPALGSLDDVQKDFYNAHITSITNIGMVGAPRGGYIPRKFNTTEFKNAEIWSFETGEEICQLESVSVTPNFHLFQQTGQTVFLNASAKSRNGQTLQSIPRVYDWSWDWESANDTIARVEQQTDPRVALATAGNVKDGQTLGRASSTITIDTLNSTTGKVVAGVSQLRLFLCENPWPVYFAIPGYVWPWKDDVTGVEFYYCRDQQGVGTTDDLPALKEDPLVGPSSRRICMMGTNVGKACRLDSDCGNIIGSCLPEVLKEFFFFREQIAQIPTIEGTIDTVGKRVNLQWDPTAYAAKYKVYYGLSSGRYTSIEEVSGTGSPITKSITGLINGLNYYFAVTALTDKNQESTFSNELRLRPTDTTAPVAPSIMGSGADKKISLFWNPVPDAASYMAYMGIEAPPSTNYPLSQIVRTTPQPNQPNTTFIGLDNAGVYYATVKSIDIYGNTSPYSSVIRVRPDDPYLISAQSARRGIVNLKWLPFVGSRGYTIKYTSNILRDPVTVNVGSSVFNYSVQNLVVGETYNFSIIANKSNNEPSNQSNIIPVVVR